MDVGWYRRNCSSLWRTDLAEQCSHLPRKTLDVFMRLAMSNVDTLNGEQIKHWQSFEPEVVNELVVNVASNEMSAMTRFKSLMSLNVSGVSFMIGSNGFFKFDGSSHVGMCVVGFLNSVFLKPIPNRVSAHPYSQSLVFTFDLRFSQRSHLQFWWIKYSQQYSLK